MFAPPVSAASSVIHPPCLSEKALVSESTLSQISFPNEFPYEFAFSSPEDSTETEDETNDDKEDDFLAGLTRRLALFTQHLPSPPPPLVTDKAEVNSTESTRSGLGSSGNKSPNGPFSQAPSRPESPVREEVAKIKVTNFDAKPKSRPNPKPNSFTPFPQNAAFYNYQYYYYYCWLRQTQPALIAYPYSVRGVFAAPTAAKQPSTGTGVFLPRNYINPSSSRKKAGKCVKFPTKVVQTKHPKTEKLSGRIQSRSQAHLCSKIDCGTKSLVTGVCLKEERHLPQK